MPKLQLKKPFLLDGKEVTEIEYDLESLTGKDVNHASMELKKRSIIISTPEIDMDYHSMIFAIAAGISFEDVQRLPLKDFNAACSEVQRFFLSDTEEW